MLRFTKRADYGLMAMHHIASHGDEGAVSAKRIAEEFHIPGELLAKILQRLAKNRLITSHNGPRGGYVLTRRPEAITVGQVVRALEGPIEITYCVGQTDRSNKCLNAEGCVSQILLRKLNVQLKAALDSTTLSDLCAEAGSGVCPTGGSARRGVRRK